LRFYENISTASAGFFVSFLRMILSGIFVPSFEVANSRVTSMSANETGEVLRSTVYRGAVGCIALATLPTLPIERLALRLHETLCLAISIVSGAFHGRAGANELFFNAVRRIETIATKNVNYSAPVLAGQPAVTGRILRGRASR
jgi:hypothetical protein